MFKETRLKLTGWYLLIIMAISGFFTLIIYLGAVAELERGFHQAEMRMRGINRRFEEIHPELREIKEKGFFIEDLEGAKKNLKLRLGILNGAILVVSALASYFLAGAALRPIEAAMEEQKRFVADASHELRTPLTALKTTVEVALRDKKLTLAKTKKVLKENLEDLAGLERLTNALLALVNRPNNNGLEIVSFKVSEAAKKAIRRIRPLAKKKEIKIASKVKPENQTLEADKDAFLELLVIFLDNAVKYTPKKGKIWLSLLAKGKELEIIIKDTGIGIEEEHLSHIFDRFYRIDSARSKKDGDGFGLGLALAKKTINLHKGSQKVDSKFGQGTNFTVILPLRQD